MIIYLAGPMTGIDDYNQKAFNAAEKHLSALGSTVLNPARITPTVNPELITHAQYLTICFTMIDICDAICLLPGWEDSIGAKRELRHAQLNGKQVIVYV